MTNCFNSSCLLTPQVGGVATNFRLPDVVSVGLGGGSVVSVQEDHETGAVSDRCVGGVGGCSECERIGYAALDQPSRGEVAWSVIADFVQLCGS